MVEIPENLTKLTKAELIVLIEELVVELEDAGGTAAPPADEEAGPGSTVRTRN